MSAKRILTQAELDSVQGLPSRLAAEKLGVGKTTVNDARAAARENNGYLPQPADQAEFNIESLVPKSDAEIADFLASRGISAQTHKLVHHFSMYEQGNATKYAYKVTASPLPASETEDGELSAIDLPTLYSEAQRSVGAPLMAALPEKATVVVWADVQVGKTGSRGGTPELIERVAQKKAALLDYIVQQGNGGEAFFLSVGDEVESFENTPQQAFTNDLSFPQQLDLELTFELDMVRMLAMTHQKVTVAGCSSNHCRWRAGKNALGKPSDDYGIYLKQQLEKALRLNQDYNHVEFQYPDEWDETMSVEFNGTRMGIAHGHQVNNPNAIEKWWTEQAFGQQAIADADILLTGHFHTFRAQPMGRSARTGKNRWWLQAPTLDNGSDWFRNLRGSDSDPGLLVFQVDEHGLDLSSLTIL